MRSTGTSISTRSKSNRGRDLKLWFVWGETPLRTILEWCWRERAVDRLLLSARLSGRRKSLEGVKPEVRDVVHSLFGSNLLETRLTRRWPGTELTDSKAAVFRIAFEPRLIDPMVQAGELLGHWQHSHQPRLPEDPCLYRSSDEWPLFFSHTHEDSGWVIADKRPPFCVRKPLMVRPDHLLIPSASEEFVGD